MRRMIMVMALAGASAGLSGCYESRLHLGDDFGRAVRQDNMAQVAEPDAKYVGIPEAGAHPKRVASSVDRYVHGQVIPPTSTKSTDVGASVDGGGGGGNGGAPSQ